MIERRKLAVQRRELQLLSGNPLSPVERDGIHDGMYTDLDLTDDQILAHVSGPVERSRSRTPTGFGFGETGRQNSVGDMSTLSALERARGSTAGSPMSPRLAGGGSYDEM